MKKESRYIKLAVEEFFFAFLVILLIILIYGLFQPDPGFGFFAPHWKKLDLILGVIIFLGIFIDTKLSI
jgi:hypothetical protein